MRKALIAVGLLAASTLSGAVRADEPEPPSRVLPILGGALVGAGAYMSYHYAAEAADHDPRCWNPDRHCYWLGLGGALVEQGGGALATMWAWKLAEHDFARDNRQGQTKDRQWMSITGMTLAGVGLVIIYASAIYVAAHTIGCVNLLTSERNYPCQAHAAKTGALVNLAGLPFLVVGAPLAGYGLGYRWAADQTAGQRAFRDLRLSPMWNPHGGGLALHARF